MTEAKENRMFGFGLWREINEDEYSMYSPYPYYLPVPNNPLDERDESIGDEPHQFIP